MQTALRFQKDLLQKVSIYLSGQFFFDRSRKQGRKQFGKPVYAREGNKESYQWTDENHVPPLKITLERKVGEWAATLTVVYKQN